MKRTKRIFLIASMAITAAACGVFGLTACNGEGTGNGGNSGENDSVNDNEVLTPTEGLEYEEVDGGYEVIGIGTATDTHIVIPSTYNGKSVISVGYEAFNECKSITSVTILEGVQYVNLRLTDCKNLTNVSIPDSLTEIYCNFEGCDKLKYNEYDNALYIGNKSNKYLVLIKAKNKEIKTCNVNENTKLIYSNAFEKCTVLTSVKMGKNVIDIGEETFMDCNSLVEVTIPNGTTELYRTFKNCSSLKKIIIPDGVRWLTENTFTNCSSLVSVTIPVSVTDMLIATFADCTSLKDITYKGTKAQWQAIWKENDWDENTGNYTVHCTDGDISKS